MGIYVKKELHRTKWEWVEIGWLIKGQILSNSVSQSLRGTNFSLRGIQKLNRCNAWVLCIYPSYLHPSYWFLLDIIGYSLGRGNETRQEVSTLCHKIDQVSYPSVVHFLAAARKFKNLIGNK